MEQHEAERSIFNEALSNDDRDYVMELTTYGLQRLEKEPHYLATEKSRLDKELEDVTVDNLSIFLQTSTTVDESQKLVHSMQSHVDDVITLVPDLIQKSKDFSVKTRELRAQRKANRQIVANQMKVLEILELPQLMWKCARAKLYQQALDLESYAMDLLNRNPDILILKSLIGQMKKTQKYILNELLVSLEKSIQLPQCLKIIGYLTRMNVFNDQLLLRKEFLSRRLKYLESLLPKPIETHSSTDSFDYLSRFMDLYRMHIFAIVTQYKAIFVDTFSDDDTAKSTVQNGERSLTEDLLVIWVHQRVIHIISTIEKLLPFVSSGSFLNSLAQTCDYCGQSLGHVSMDFRGLLPPIFEKRIISLFQHNMNTAILQFQSALTSHDWFVTVELLSSMGVKTEENSPTNTGNEHDGHSSLRHNPNTGEIEVPQILLQYPPLAVLTNGFIKAFNELREFVTYSVMTECRDILVHSIQSTVNSIRKFSVTSHLRPTLSNRRSSVRRRRSAMKRKMKSVKKQKPESVKSERKRSMAQVPSAMDLDIEDADKGDDGEAVEEDVMEEEIDEVLSNLVKVECEYLLPFLCDIFDLVFERRKEIEMDDLLEYFVGLYQVPKFTVISDDEEENDGMKGDRDSTAESKKGHSGRTQSNLSELSHSELANVTFVNQDDVDDNNKL